MDFKDAEEKLYAKNKILFSQKSSCLQELIFNLSTCDRKTVVLWALECSENTAKILKQNYPLDLRPQKAIEASWAWARGIIKMPEARGAILDIHKMAKDMAISSHEALCHAVGQGCSTVHTTKHAIGLPIYELTALVREHGFEESINILENKIIWYNTVLVECQKKSHMPCYIWADFILKNKKQYKTKNN
jgi:hypothetical protein